MKIIVTPMCEDILKWNNISDYIVNKFPDKEENVDIAILLSESKTKYPSISLKLNTFKQIKESLEIINKKLSKERIETCDVFKQYPETMQIINNLKEYRNKNKNINVKVYSYFLKDIVNDLGYNINEDKYDYIICPDYLEINEIKNNIIRIPSHGNVSNNPIKRATSRYLSIINNI